MIDLVYRAVHRDTWLLIGTEMKYVLAFAYVVMKKSEFNCTSCEGISLKTVSDELGYT